MAIIVAMMMSMIIDIITSVISMICNIKINTPINTPSSAILSFAIIMCSVFQRRTPQHILLLSDIITECIAVIISAIEKHHFFLYWLSPHHHRHYHLHRLSRSKCIVALPSFPPWLHSSFAFDITVMFHHMIGFIATISCSHHNYLILCHHHRHRYSFIVITSPAVESQKI